MDTPLVFKPRPSLGWLSLLVMTLFLVGLSITVLLDRNWLTGGLFVLLGVYFLAILAYYPAMRYELTDAAVIIRYGPLLRYEIPYDTIRSMQRRSLGLTLWSSMRFPGIALFTVPYSDAGGVRMCATAALKDILLIQTDSGSFGITPDDEAGFMAAVQQRMGRQGSRVGVLS
ncbi:MAG: hypothetical protein GYA17_20865 [Chloroflexi bacterium]|jgi:hypothetical protein|nr:PH domain-containing protein [Anaerolineaceae bacterium]NMB90820.1 hypothetical protein [Chloroflexota bacterium]